MNLEEITVVENCSKISVIKILFWNRETVNLAHYFMNNCLIQRLSARVNYTLNEWFDYKIVRLMFINDSWRLTSLCHSYNVYL